jgi:aryl-alcohol dehydrogenase-like predicted oxidoreductase
MFTRELGRSGIKTSAMGLGCWAIGGNHWGDTDDKESIRAIHRALDMGINLLDTAEGYGEDGHSEEVIGKALAGRRDKVVIATKFGNQRTELDDIRRACEASLKRLRTDYIDLYQYHSGPRENGEKVLQAVEKLVEEGKIRWYGWSTDDAESIRILARGAHCTAAQTALNVLRRNPEALAACSELNLASINRSPLAMGILSGKFTVDTTFAKGDIRGAKHPWLKVYFEDGKPRADLLEKLDAIRQILTSEGRTLVQGALAWIWGRSERTIPIPGFKTVKQIEENIAAMNFGPLNAEQMKEIDTLLGH